MVKIATWNVNSIKARLPNLLEWLPVARPDIVLLQELKCQDEGFPGLEIKAAGYEYLTVGQKSYNGVAVLSTQPIQPRLARLPGGEGDDHARYLEVETHGLVVSSIYLPNGNPVTTDKFPYKLAWLDRLVAHARTLLLEERPLVLAGDYNVIPTALDCYDPQAWVGDALFRPETRARFRQLQALGLTDAFRALHPDRRAYSFWDYQRGAWQHDLGIRIDHLLLSPQAADRLAASGIDRAPRGKERASDHTPVWCELR